MGYRDTQGTLDLFDYLDYTWFFNNNEGTYVKYYSGWNATYQKQEQILITGKNEGIDDGFGKFDQIGDPQFAHPERRMTTLDSYL